MKTVKKADTLALISILLPAIGVSVGLLFYLLLYILGFDDTDHNGSIAEPHQPQTSNGRNIHPNIPGEYWRRGYSGNDVNFYPDKLLSRPLHQGYQTVGSNNFRK